MKMDDYKKKIMDLINGIEDTPTLRELTNKVGSFYFNPRHSFINSSICFNFSGEASAIALSIFLAI